MRTVEYKIENLRKVFNKKKVLQMKSIMEELGTYAKITAFRKLKQLSYQASYSHAGRYYRLTALAQYDKYGLWKYKGIYFSEQGTLISTLKYLIEISEQGYFTSELKQILKVRVREALLKLYLSRKVYRKQLGREYLYLSVNDYEEQFEKRKQLIELNEVEKKESKVPGFETPESHRCLKLLLSTLNEKQRRLYVGFESMKLGYGGDKKMSEITGMNIKTIASGRKKLLSNEITPGRIRKEGGGRLSIKKN